jgi:FkbH-like protein
VQKKIREGLRHQEISLSESVRLIQPSRAEGSPIRIPILFNMLPARQLLLPQGQVRLSVEAIDGGDQGIDVLFTMADDENGLHGQISFNRCLIAAVEVRNLIDGFTRALEVLTSSSESRLAELISELPKVPASTSDAQPRHSVVVTSTFTAQPIAEVFQFWAKELGARLDLCFAPNGQVFQQLLDVEGLPTKNRAGTHIVLIRLSDWLEAIQVTSERRSHMKILEEDYIAPLVRAIQASVSKSSLTHIICCAPSNADSQKASSESLYSDCERLIADKLTGLPGVEVITTKDILRLYPVDNYYDQDTDLLGQIPFTPTFFAALGTALVRKLYRLNGPRRKVIAVDCDDTLWNGLCGEGGPAGVSIDVGRRWLQNFLVKQREAGMVLCLCSKNDAPDVEAVFERYVDMPLKRAHLFSEKINWQRKSENLRQLATELRVGLDSIIFIDNDPVECAEVRTNTPEVLTLELPSNSDDIPSFMSRIWAFDARKPTQEDSDRAGFYERDASRQQCLADAPTLLDFLRTLKLQVSIAAAAVEDLPRASELTFRVNQFNSTGARCSVSELGSLNRKENGNCLIVRASDRFGDYGIVGVLLVRTEIDSLEVDAFALSCRAFGRGIEERIIEYLGRLAQDKGIGEIDFYYRVTPKNERVRDFFRTIGCVEKLINEDSSKFVLSPNGALNCVRNTEDRLTPRIDRRQSIATNGASSEPPHEDLFVRADEMYIARELFSADRISKALTKGRAPDPASRADVRPRTPTERVLAEVWAELLNTTIPSIQANFFENGGDSLLGVRLLAEIRRRLSVDIPVSALFVRNLNIESLARSIDAQQILESESGDVSRILHEMDSLTDDEVRSFLEHEN